MCSRVKNAKRLDLDKPIYLPGERGDSTEKKIIADDKISLRKSDYEALLNFK